jgi:serine/threonine protein kinase
LDAKDVNLRRGVAMKVMLEPEKAGKDQILRFIQEAQVTSQLEHPSIVPVHELGVDAGGNVFYTMKFVKGRSLKDIIKGIRDGDTKTVEDYTFSHLLTIFQKVCDAIAFAHSKRVIHRDLKPENVMVGDYGEVQVMDWGLAKVLPKKAQRHRGTKGQSQKSDIRKQPAIGDRKSEIGNAGIDSVRGDEIGEVLKTMDGQIMGTPGFMSPEQALGRTDEVDERTDIYALGAILYNILTLDVPIKGKTLAEIIDKVTTGKIVKPTEYNDKRIQKSESRSQNEKEDESRVTNHVSLVHLPDNQVPESLSAVAMKALHIDPWKRYQWVKEIQKEIEAYQTGFATKAEKAGIGKQLKLLIRRNKGVFTALAACLVVMIAGSVAFMVRVVASEKKALSQQAVAEKTLLDFKAEQASRKVERRHSAPIMVSLAWKLLNQKDYDAATAMAETAVEYDSDSIDGWLLAAVLRFYAEKYPLALEAAKEYRRLRPGERESAVLLASCISAAKGGSKNLDLSGMISVLTSKNMFALAADYTQKQDKSKGEWTRVIELHRATINKTWPGYGAGLDIKDNVLGLSIFQNKNFVIEDLSPLKGIPLAWLKIDGVPVSDISPLTGMQLTYLSLAPSVPVKDLSPLRDMPLKYLYIGKSSVSDIRVLEGMPLNYLSLNCMPNLRDLSPLKGLPITQLLLGELPNVRTLKAIEGMALNQLSLGRLPNITDLTSLKGMALTSFFLGDMPAIADLSPLKGMPLSSFDMRRTAASDLTPLKGMPITSITIHCMNILDFSPLKGMPLTSVELIQLASLTDLTYFKDMPLQALNLSGSAVSDLSPLSSISSLRDLRIASTKVNDLSPLRGMLLNKLYFTLGNIVKGMDAVRQIKGLVNINDVPAAEFWKKYDAGAFK